MPKVMALKWSLIERPAAAALARKAASSSAVRTSPRLRVMRPSSSGAGAGAAGAWVGLDAVAVMAGLCDFLESRLRIVTPIAIKKLQNVTISFNRPP